MSISHDRLLSLVTYDPETGALFLRKATTKRAAGTRIELITNTGRGYYVTLGDHHYRANRLAYFYMTGMWPTDLIDHKNGDPFDNRWGNLRPATHQQNSANRRIRSDNSHGIKGVTKTKTGWQARIKVSQKCRHIGTFRTADEAAAAYEAAAKGAFGEFARTDKRI